jgi:hypothetical protein
VVNACVLVGQDGRMDPTCEIMARSPLGPGPQNTMRLLGFMAGACVFRRAAYLWAGGYEPRFFIGGEETLLALDLAAQGWDMLYAGYIRTRHLPSPRRDRPGREYLLSRNALWTAWLRLPMRAALRESAAELRRAAGRGCAMRVAGAALAGLPWALRRRRPIPESLEQQRVLVARGPLAAPAVPCDAGLWLPGQGKGDHTHP